jgi:hypothetical protein
MIRIKFDWNWPAGSGEDFFQYKHVLFVYLLVFESHKQFLSYLATVTITSYRAANLDLCLLL